ncbi:MAG: hypothetical protein HY680_00365 [Chloroflexi bacterium]|nr:hypothetical protein [Chloroflexota bacterium]
MDTPSQETVDAALKHSGMDPSPQDRERLRTMYEQFLPRLQALRALNLDDEEAAGVFVPQQR